MLKIIPAVLTGNPAVLRQRLNRIRSIFDWVQIDIMDGLFVDNTSIKIDELSNLNFDFKYEAHLMVYEPQKYFEICAKANIKRVVFHYEAVENPDDILEKMEEFDFEKAMALNPKTQIKEIELFLEKTDAVLLLSVEPGFGAQDFIPQTLNKVSKIKQIAPYKKIGLDGGINKTNIKEAVNSGADYLVIGSALFQSPNIRQTYSEMKELIKN